MSETAAGIEGKGAKRRSGIPMRTVFSPEARRIPELRRTTDDGKDSGLSSESTTPVNVSPPPRQLQGQLSRRTKMRDIIAASKARLQESERLNTRTTRLLNSRSSTESSKSLESTRSRQIFSPLRPPRNVQSPIVDSGDEGSLRIERGTYSYMFQDIVSIKTMLLKLKRVLQESGENGLTRSETLNPFDNSLKNGLFYNLNDGTTTTDQNSSPNNGRDPVDDELTDLRRQVVFLQGQVEDKDKMIQTLQSQLTKYQNGNIVKSMSEQPRIVNGNGESLETSNAATQTEKLRPVSAGPSILQGYSQDNGMGTYVSWNDSWSEYPQQSLYPRVDSSSSTTSSSCTSTSGKPTSRRSSSDSQHQFRFVNQRGLRPPESPRIRISRNKTDEVVDVASPTRSAIPTPRRLAVPTHIPRPARSISQERLGVQLL